ncbi:hypothetical protein G7Y89_g2429 [Cudoniella acicularis]|uniref:Uncharacterized protein n=1 Tax=Cudoniella acicularis TaxID=354080 RepID=A0A8H4RVC9_9HELO|nr:hypothetical protein G7Y89_g2429 [Cudoniella acicularis]
MEDRLIALAGVAKSLHQRTGAKYVAGLWDVELQYGLSWVAEKLSNSNGTAGFFAHLRSAEQSTGQERRKRRRPTWTWASLDSQFSWPFYLRPDNDFALREISLEYSDGSLEVLQ